MWRKIIGTVKIFMFYIFSIIMLIYSIKIIRNTLFSYRNKFFFIYRFSKFCICLKTEYFPFGSIYNFGNNLVQSSWNIWDLKSIFLRSNCYHYESTTDVQLHMFNCNKWVVYQPTTITEYYFTKNRIIFKIDFTKTCIFCKENLEYVWAFY